VAELWIPSNADVILINKSAPRDELVESAVNSTFSMAENALHLLKEGVTNLEELMRTLPYATIYRIPLARRRVGRSKDRPLLEAHEPPLASRFSPPRCGW
jgi:hypothetical protein